MSAWMHGNYHLSAVVNTMYAEVGSYPWYSHHGETVESNVNQSGPYLPPEETRVLNDATCTKAIGSIDYQSCEYDDWGTSLARRLLQVMRETILERTGYGPDASDDAWNLSNG